jgi:hypothetical protein
MLVHFKGPSIFGVLLGNASNSVGERATAKLFSYGMLGATALGLATLLLIGGTVLAVPELP